MLNFSHQTRVFLCTSPVDMRKSFRGLCSLAESLLEKDPAGQDWFVFVNRRGDRMKLSGWDGRGFWIWYMHLEAGLPMTKWLVVGYGCLRSGANGGLAEPTDAELLMITSDAKRLVEVRYRLSDVSWWMRCTAENIARRSNKEDNCSGRFRAVRIEEEATLLARAAYVDLNSVRAAIAEILEESDHTPVQRRLGAMERTAKDSNCVAANDASNSVAAESQEKNGASADRDFGRRACKRNPIGRR